MTSTKELLPQSPHPDFWTDEEKSVAAFIGFTAEVNQKVQDETGKEVWQKSTIVAPLGVRSAYLSTLDRTQLDPIARQIYLILFNGKWTICLSIDGFRLVSERTGKYRGQTHPQWSSGEEEEWIEGEQLVTDGNGQAVVHPTTGDLVFRPVVKRGIRWHDVWTADEPPAVARVGVWRDGAAEPIYGIATWKAYAKTDRKGKLTGQWENNGPHMLAIRAEAQAHRKAFPMELSGLYLEGEFDGQDRAEDGIETTGREWLDELDATETVAQVTRLYAELQGTPDYNKHLDAEFRARRAKLAAQEHEAAEANIEDAEVVVADAEA